MCNAICSMRHFVCLFCCLFATFKNANYADSLDLVGCLIAFNFFFLNLLIENSSTTIFTLKSPNAGKFHLVDTKLVYRFSKIHDSATFFF